MLRFTRRHALPPQVMDWLENIDRRNARRNEDTESAVQDAMAYLRNEFSQLGWDQSNPNAVPEEFPFTLTDYPATDE